ncbi:hypothetical protein PC128_g9002 [Phytophthora cactorum]|nr:hypothetical protein PC128_g9002 [Phytophthora cactorum]
MLVDSPPSTSAAPIPGSLVTGLRPRSPIFSSCTSLSEFLTFVHSQRHSFQTPKYRHRPVRTSLLRQEGSPFAERTYPRQLCLGKSLLDLGQLSTSDGNSHKACDLLHETTLAILTNCSSMKMTETWYSFATT